MNKKYVTFEQAKFLQNKGFKEKTNYYKSFREAEKNININRSYINKYLDTNLPYKSSLKYKEVLFFSLTKEEYQKMTINK